MHPYRIFSQEHTGSHIHEQTCVVRANDMASAIIHCPGRHDLDTLIAVGRGLHGNPIAASYRWNAARRSWVPAEPRRT